jgi:hypothetical protein
MAKRQILHSLRDRRENISCDNSNNPPSQKTNGPSLKYWLQYKEEKIHFSYDIIIPPPSTRSQIRFYPHTPSVHMHPGKTHTETTNV